MARDALGFRGQAALKGALSFSLCLAFINKTPKMAKEPAAMEYCSQGEGKIKAKAAEAKTRRSNTGIFDRRT